MSGLKIGISSSPDQINAVFGNFGHARSIFDAGTLFQSWFRECYDPSQFDFGERDMSELEERKYIAISASKDIRIIEGLREGGICRENFFLWRNRGLVTCVDEFIV